MATSGKSLTINIVLLACAISALGIAFMASKSKKPMRTLPYIGNYTMDSILVDGKYKTDTNYHQALDFKLTDQFGQTVTLDTFKNKVFVANFFFATCPGICKKMNSLLESATLQFKGNSSVKFVSYTIDPLKDSVPVLLDYAKLHNAVPYQWYFLTGDKNAIYNLARKSYYAAVDDSAGGNFVHTPNMALVDMQRHIRGIYNGTDSAEVNKMVVDIKLLLQEEKSKSLNHPRMNFNGELQALFSLQGLTSLIVLSLLELVLGIDNIIFISLAITKLPEEKRLKVRVTGLSIAFVMRILMLIFIVWLSQITKPLFTISHFEVSISDILFFNAGIYLVVSSIKEIAGFFNVKKTINPVGTGTGRHQPLANSHQPLATPLANSPVADSYKRVVVLIVMIDMLFSFDSIFTAIGLISNFIIMALAIGSGTVFMIYISGKTSGLMEKYPSLKIMALYFIMIVGLSLLAKAFHIEIPKGYFYAALAFTMVMEQLIMKRKKR